MCLEGWEAGLMQLTAGKGRGQERARGGRRLMAASPCRQGAQGQKGLVL